MARGAAAYGGLRPGVPVTRVPYATLDCNGMSHHARPCRCTKEFFRLVGGVLTVESSGEWLRLEHIEKGTWCQNFYALIFAKIEEELIAADQKVRFPFDGTFQVAIIRRIVCNDRQGEPGQAHLASER